MLMFFVCVCVYTHIWVFIRMCECTCENNSTTLVVLRQALSIVFLIWSLLLHSSLLGGPAWLASDP